MHHPLSNPTLPELDAQAECPSEASCCSNTVSQCERKEQAVGGQDGLLMETKFSTAKRWVVEEMMTHRERVILCTLTLQ
jgi:hypothetical protein